MARINLLPWREWESSQRRQRFLLSLVLSLVVGIVIVVWATFMVGGAMSIQQSRNSYLRQQLAQLDQKIKTIKDLKKERESLLRRMRVIEKLEQSRSQVVHLFDQLTRTVPESVYLTGLKNHDGVLSIDGVAQSPAGVSLYMQNIAHSPWLGDPNLTVVRTQNKGKLSRSEFSVTTKLIQPADEKGKGAAGGGS